MFYLLIALQRSETGSDVDLPVLEDVAAGAVQGDRAFDVVGAGLRGSHSARSIRHSSFRTRCHCHSAGLLRRHRHGGVFNRLHRLLRPISRHPSRQRCRPVLSVLDVDQMGLNCRDNGQ